MKHILLAGLTMLLISACATSPTGRSQLMLISPDMAISESKAAYLSTVTDITREHRLVTDDAW
ncbi:MAG: M48 family peptidase, partial [Saccharospirillum sp.]